MQCSFIPHCCSYLTGLHQIIDTVNGDHQPQSSKLARYFSTTCRSRASGDASTIDFAFLPSGVSVEPEPVEEVVYRVPILPTNYTQAVNAQPEEPPVIKPTIFTMSEDAVFLPMSDLSDDHSLGINFNSITADQAASDSGHVKEERQVSMMKRIWFDMVDDMLGIIKGPNSSARA